MKHILGLLIALVFLGYGVVRIGVGAALLAQTSEILNVLDLAEGVADVKTFIDARANEQLFRLVSLDISAIY